MTHHVFPASVGRVVVWLDDDERRAWVGLVRMQTELQARLNRQLQVEHRISLADYEILGRLQAATDHRLRARELGATLAWEQSRLSHQLARMERRDLVRREPCAQDRRGVVFAMTDAGRQTIEAAAPSHVAAVRRLFLEALTSRQIAQFGAIASAVLQGLAEGDDQL